MASSMVKINSYEMDGLRVGITFIDGKKYILQHPGNRVYLKWQQEFFSLTEGMDQALFLDQAFEHCVIPDCHDFKPTIDTVKPKEVTEWSKLLRRFCSGDIDNVVVQSVETTNTKGNSKKAQKGDNE